MLVQLLQGLGLGAVTHQFPGTAEKKVNKAKAETCQAKKPKTAKRIPGIASSLGGREKNPNFLLQASKN